MERYEIIEEVKKYFKIKELVSEITLKHYGENKCWSFFSKELLETLLVLRTEIIKKPMRINSYLYNLHQRGLRTNMDPIVKDKKSFYVSAHCLGQGLDFDVNGMIASEVRQLIRDKQDLLPHHIRLEDDKSAPTWVHFDVCNITEDKVVEFSA